MQAQPAKSNLSGKAWTVLELLRWATDDFSSRHVRNARLDAEVLLAHALGTSRVGLYLRYDCPVGEREREIFCGLVLEHRQRVPVAYLTGEKEFYSLSFAVDRRVLIPRPETELLVDEALRLAAEFSQPRICDVGTGSGAIAVTLARKLPKARIVAVDTSEEALQVARGNADRHRVRIEFRQSDLLDEVEGNFALIVANLPYVPTSVVPTLSPDVRDHEPTSALNGGANGLQYVNRLLESAGSHILQGYLLLEIDPDQFNAVARKAEQQGFRIKGVREDLTDRPRVVIAAREEIDVA